MHGICRGVLALLFVSFLSMPVHGQDPPENPKQPAIEDINAGDPADADSQPYPEDEQGANDEEEMGILIKDIVFEGNRVIDTPTLRDLTASYRGQTMSLREMGELTDLVTITYQEKGYILARAYLPEQEIAKGVLKIAIAEGNVGKIKVVGEKYYSPEVLKRYFSAQKSHGVIKEDLLEEGIVMSTKLPDVKTSIYLKEGEEAGTTDLVIEAKDTPSLTMALHLNADYNNYGSETVGEDRYGVNVDMVEHKWGSRFQLRGSTGDTYGTSHLLSASWSIPFLDWGSEIGLNYFKGNTFLQQEFANFGLGITPSNTDIETWGIQLSHPLIKRRATKLNVTAGYQRRKFKSFYESGGTFDDVIDDRQVVLARINFENTDRFLGRNFFNFEYDHGQVEPPIKRTTGISVVSSRSVEADTTYNKYMTQLGRVQKIYGYTNLLVRFAGQYSDNRLPVTEEFGIGGYWTVRGHPVSKFQGDTGFALTTEVMTAPPLIADNLWLGQRIGQMVQLIAFYDWGATFIQDHWDAQTEDKDEYLAGWGGGLRFYFKNLFTFKYTVGVPVTQQTDARNFYQYFEVSYKFF